MTYPVVALGISTFTYGWSVGVDSHKPAAPLTCDELTRMAVDNGLGCIQLGDNLPVHVLTMQQRENLRTALVRHNIRVELGARKLTEEHLQLYLDLCRYFHAPLLRFVIDGDGYEPDTKLVASIVRKFLPALEKENITLGIENHDRFKATELAELMEDIGSDSVGICLDGVNSMGAGEGLDYVADVLAPYTVNLHIKDFMVRRLSHKMGFMITGSPAGQGMFDVPRMMKKLVPYKRLQSAILEQWVPFENNIEATAAMEKQWAEQSILYLKSLPWFVQNKTQIT